MDKIDGPEKDKSEWIKLEFLMDLDNPDLDYKYPRKFSIFKDGCQENWIKWVMAFREIENLMPMKEPVDKTRMFPNLLRGQALSCFGHHRRRKLEAEDTEVLDNDLIQIMLREMYIDLQYIPERAICVQKYLMLFLDESLKISAKICREVE
jgi:hypothetical protein